MFEENTCFGEKFTFFADVTKSKDVMKYFLTNMCSLYSGTLYSRNSNYLRKIQFHNIRENDLIFLAILNIG